MSPRTRPTEPKALDAAPHVSSPALDALLHELPSGWEAATQYHQLKRALPKGRSRQLVTERAIDAVVARARDLVRHAARPTRTERTRWPQPGELDLDATLEALDVGPRGPDQDGVAWRPEGICVARTVPRDADVVAILDMSLSMNGEKIALVAVAAAILHLKLDRVSVVSFDTFATTLVPLGAKLDVREVVRRVLTVPAQGYTHISAGLKEGLDQLVRSRRKERVGLLLSDGISNVGRDPVYIAQRYPTLHVIQVGRDVPQGRRACTRMAQAGQGDRWHAPTYLALPQVVRQVVREVFRG